MVGTPSNLVPPPCGFGISTARTGGGNQVPEDIRFHTLYRLPCRSASNSSIDTPSTPGAPLFALTFSQASLTAHFEISNGLSGDFNSPIATPPEPQRVSVDPMKTATDDPTPSLHPHYRGFTTTTSRSASRTRDGTHTHAIRGLLPFTHPGNPNGQCRIRPSPVPCRSRRPGSRRLHAGHRLANQRAPARLIPGSSGYPGFDVT